jgi:hypothetical protein
LLLGYSTTSTNGVRPEEYIPRSVADDVVKYVTSQREDVRVLLRGPPGSGKTCVMGEVHRQLVELHRDTDTDVYYLFATDVLIESERLQVMLWLSHRNNVILFVDDAQKLYKHPDFFDTFKSKNTLVAAASYRPDLFNDSTPVDLEDFRVDVRDDELPRVLKQLGLEGDHPTAEQIVHYFGRSFGMITILGAKLLDMWKTSLQTKPKETLKHFYRQACILKHLKSSRMMPELAPKLREMLVNHYLGRKSEEEKTALVNCGLLRDDGLWSCDFMRRFYFTQLFHSKDRIGDLFDDDRIPSSSELLCAGLSQLPWDVLQRNLRSSAQGKVPIEDIWQTAFYMAVGMYIPQHMSFCKEYAAGGGHVDFVLHNGVELGIEFLMNSARIVMHHERFEGEGNYSFLQLQDYIVCDIVVAKPDESSEATPNAVIKSFGLTGSEQRKTVHSVFLIRPDLSHGDLYVYVNGTIRLAKLKDDGKLCRRSVVC